MSAILEKALSGLGLGVSEGSTEMKVGGSKGGPGKSRCKRGSRRNKAVTVSGLLVIPPRSAALVELVVVR